MRWASPIQRLVAFLCLILLLLTALTPSAVGHTFAIIFVVLWSILPLSVFFQRVDIPNDHDLQRDPATAVLSPRAPPSL